MARSPVARYADLPEIHPAEVVPNEGPSCKPGAPVRGWHSLTPYGLCTRHARLLARIESGTATVDDMVHLPRGVLDYVDAVSGLCDAGVLDLHS